MDRKINDNQILYNTKRVLINSNQILNLLKCQPKERSPIKQLKLFVKKSDSKGKGRGK